MKTYNKIKVLMTALMLTAVSTSYAGTAVGEMVISATVENVCTINAPANIALPAYDMNSTPSSELASSTLDIVCTDGSGFSVAATSAYADSNNDGQYRLAYIVGPKESEVANYIHYGAAQAATATPTSKYIISDGVGEGASSTLHYPISVMVEGSDLRYIPTGSYTDQLTFTITF